MCSSVTARRRWKHTADGGWVCADDEVAVEAPLEIRVQGRPVSITMRTPGHDEDLVAGFLLSEGVLRTADDLRHVRSCHAPEGDSVEAHLAPSANVDMARLARQVVGSSSCGICGSASIEAVRRRAPPLGAGPRIEPAVLATLPERLRAEQSAFARTGGLHAAALFDLAIDDAGVLVVAREDVGRHNAVDKVLGHALRRGLLPLSDVVLMVSGRASFEIVQKAIAAGVAIVAAVSAPSSLAVDLAEQANVTLVGFLRGATFTAYTHRERLAGVSER